jgi:hypothetical protein
MCGGPVFSLSRRSEGGRRRRPLFLFLPTPQAQPSLTLLPSTHLRLLEVAPTRTPGSGGAAQSERPGVGEKAARAAAAIGRRPATGRAAAAAMDGRGCGHAQRGHARVCDGPAATRVCGPTGGCGERPKNPICVSSLARALFTPPVRVDRPAAASSAFLLFSRAPTPSPSHVRLWHRLRRARPGRARPQPEQGLRGAQPAVRLGVVPGIQPRRQPARRRVLGQPGPVLGCAAVRPGRAQGGHPARPARPVHGVERGRVGRLFWCVFFSFFFGFDGVAGVCTAGRVLHPFPRPPGRR